MANCSTGATQQREDSIVWVDYELCIGCGSCVEACPYEGVRTTITEEPEYYLDVVVGEVDAPPHKVNTTEKYNFCYNLIDRGEVPACMQLCPAARATGAIWTTRNLKFPRRSRVANTNSCMRMPARAPRCTT